MRYLAEKCGNCGACVSVCRNIELAETGIIFNSKCENCAACASVCPFGALIFENAKGRQE